MICIVCIIQCRPDYSSNPPVYDAIVPPTLADGFSLLLFAFNGILSFPHLERTMKEPKSWHLSSFFAMLLTCLAFFLIGIMGYWAYGNSAMINFFSNLPQSKLNIAKFSIFY
jgi:amino acid permease